MLRVSWSRGGCHFQALGLLSGRKKWETRRAVLAGSALLIKKAKAASRRLSLIHHGEDVDHMATPSSKRVWGSHSSSLSLYHGSCKFGSDHWSFRNQQCLSHSLKEGGDCQALDKEALGL